MIKRLIFITAIQILAISCSNDRGSLNLEILNEEFIAFCPDSTCIHKDRFKQKDIYTEYVNIVEFKITNPTDKNYVFIPICNDIDPGCATYTAFPRLFSGISLNNLIFQDSNGKSLFSEDSPFGGYPDQEKEILEYYAKINKGSDEVENMYKGFSMENMIVIPAGETKYFETFFTAPFNLPSIYSSREYIELDKNQSYKVSLFFKADRKEVLKTLSSPQKRTFEENNYVIFDGELRSKNAIPLSFK